MTSPWQIIQSRPRLFIGAATGLVAALLLQGRLTPLSRALTAWDIGCIVSLVLWAIRFSVVPPSRMAADAEAQEEGEWTIFWFTIAGVFASFAAIIGEFSASKDIPVTIRNLHVALVAATLFVSWLMTHTLFALRYAHEYYGVTGTGTGAGTGTGIVTEIDKGLEFPGDLPPDYWDFFYFALVLGMTFQVSDVEITSRKLRRLATAHGLLGFLFNTVILALSVNIGASLL